jgi:hypothetical protein
MRWGKCPFAYCRRGDAGPPALLAVQRILVRDCRAEGLSGYLELDYSRSDIENTGAGGWTIKSRFDGFTQLYSLTLDKKLYPN